MTRETWNGLFAVLLTIGSLLGLWHREATRGLRRLHKIVEVNVSTKTGVVEFAVTTESPALSLRVAQRMLELVNDYNLRRRQSQARQEREFLEGRLTEVRRELSQAEDSLARFSRRNRRLADSPELQVEQERLQRQVTLRQQIYLTLAQNYEAAKLDVPAHYWIWDGVHPTYAGHQLMADEWVRTVQQNKP